MDYTVYIEVSVTADSAEEAAKFAMDDLRDRRLGPWNVEAKSRLGKTKVEID